MIQQTLDTYMIDEGVSRYRKTVEDKRTRENESATGYGQRLLSHALVPLSDAIAAWIKASDTKKAGRKMAALVPLQSLSTDVVAFLTTRSVLDSIGLTKSYASACQIAGVNIENELRFTWLKKQHPGMFKKLERQLERCMSNDHKRTVIVHAMNKSNLVDKKGAPFQPFGRSLQIIIGATLIDLFCSSTGLAEVHTFGVGKRLEHVLQATAKTTEWILKYNEYAELLDPVWLPMVDVPLKWSSPWAGGYNNEELPATPLVKRVTDAYLENYAMNAVMPDVYDTINALQETPWRINTRVQGIVEHFWNIGRGVGALPASEDMELPTKPHNIETDKEALKEWKIRASRIHAGNAALRSTRLQARKLINLAQKFSNVPQFYLPYQLDFRGRVYTTPAFLSPQGSDLSRSLLQFAEGVSVMNDADAHWLCIYGANLFGKDKVRFEERIEWVKANRENILAVARDPLGCQWWQEADESWQFLAWCFEWAGWLTQGPGFLTHLPVCLDGTNNGLQILSMLTRDELAAKATNVMPSDTPADIYGDVAKRVVVLLQAEKAPLQKVKADYWLSFIIDRKTTKRPVMVLPYGGTFHSCRDYVNQWYKETCKARKIEMPDGPTIGARCHYLATLIWEAIEFCVGRPREAMVWLQACAVLMTKAGLPISWTAPSGFPVLQAYKDVSAMRVETMLGDSARRIQISLATDHPTKLSASRQKNGISPNFVHSLDAAALVKTVKLCLEQKLTSFAMIHDSYGTHAPRMHEMAAALRVAFVSIFTDDWLNKLRDQLQAQLDQALAKDDAGNPVVLPPVPAFGGLDVRSLLESEFFFA